jgi:hypothetical protein
MTDNEKQSNGTENFSQEKIGTFLKAIQMLAGDKSNLNINFQELKFSIGKTRITFNGKVDFDVLDSQNFGEQNTTS